jgi:hypothetical protein
MRKFSEELQFPEAPGFHFRRSRTTLEGGQTLGAFLDDFPTVSKEAAVAALEFAKSLLVDQLG